MYLNFVFFVKNRRVFVVNLLCIQSVATNTLPKNKTAARIISLRLFVACSCNVWLLTAAAYATIFHAASRAAYLRWFYIIYVVDSSVVASNA